MVFEEREPRDPIAVDLRAPARWGPSPARRGTAENPLTLFLHDVIARLLLECQQTPGLDQEISITKTKTKHA